MARQSNPTLKRPRMFNRASRTQSSEDFLKQLEELLRLNRGGFSTFAEDTDAPTGFIVPGGVPVRQGNAVGEDLGTLNRVSAPAPIYPEIPEQEAYDPTIEGDTFLPDQPTVSQFINYLNQTSSQPEQLTTEQLQAVQQVTGNPYAVAQNQDGTVTFSDGSVGYAEQLQPMATLEGNRVLWSDGVVRNGPQISDIDFESTGQFYGVEGLSSYLFGGNQQTVTQEFGNINPIEPTPGNVNLGTDFRTRDLASRNLSLPTQATVLQVLQDDGTRFGDQSGHMGYGNSLLLQLPNGQRVRLSHLSQMGSYQPGDVIQAGEVFGTPGQTGNTYGEHLDVEVYDQQGNIVSPDQFDTQGYLSTISGREGAISDPYNPTNQTLASQSPEQPQAPNQPSMIEQVRQARDSGSNLIEAITQAPQTVQQNIQSAAQPGSNTREALGQIPEQAAQDRNLDAEFGLSETISQGPEAGRQARVEALSQQPSQYNPYRQFAGNVSEYIGDTLGVPEGGLSETIAGNLTKRTNQAFASEIGKPNERQNVPGIQQNLEDIGQDIKSRFSSGLGKISDTAGQLFDKTIEQFQPGAGLDKLRGNTSKSGGVNVNLFSRRNPKDMAPNRVVGDSAGGNILPGAPTMARGSQDTTDPFFSTDIFERVKGFTNLPGQQPAKNQALSTDIFTEDFYSDPGRVSDVFSSTYMSDPALQRATANVKQAFRQAYADPKYDQADVERILSGLPDVLTYSPDLPEPRLKPKPKPVYSSPSSDGGGNNQPAPSPEQVRDQGQATGQGVQQVSYQRPTYNRTVSAAPGTNLRADSGGSVQQVSNYGTPEKTRSAQLTYSADRNQTSLFDRAKNFTSGLFRRFFN